MPPIMMPRSPASSPQLDGPPPSPPASPARPGMIGQMTEMGVGGGNPVQTAMIGYAGMKRGAQMLLSVLPGLSAVLMPVLDALEQAIPQALSAQQEQGTSFPPGGPGGPGPGVGPPM